MFHKAHPIPRAIALALAVLVMIPIAKNWQAMAGSVHEVIQQSIGSILGM